jgi:hypothetical protein
MECLHLFNVASPRGTPFRIRARCDWLDEFLVDVFDVRLETISVAQAAIWAEGQFPSHTVFSVERID